VERDDPDVFDNGRVVYEKDWVRIRLIVDRGSRWAEVSSVHTPDVWLDLQPMINRSWDRELGHVPTPNEFASFVGENFEALKGMLRHESD
jgi:hypothetical protein